MRNSIRVQISNLKALHLPIGSSLVSVLLKIKVNDT